MARAASIADAAVYAGTIAAKIDATSAPTTTEATSMWDAAFAQANAALIGAGLSKTQTSGTIAYAQALEIERRLTSAAVLRYRQPLPNATDGHPAEEHERVAREIAEALKAQASQLAGAGEATLIDAEAVGGWSYLVDGLPPGTDVTPGAGSVPYASVLPPRGGSW